MVVQNSAGNGIMQQFPYPKSTSMILRNVISQNNALSGFKSLNAGDNFIYASQFLNNGVDGVELDASPSLRLQNSILSGNGQFGFQAYVSPYTQLAADPSPAHYVHIQIITGNQFSNNGYDGINILGILQGSPASDAVLANMLSFDNLITDNTFTGGACFPNREPIQINASGGNSVTGNTITGGLNTACPFGGTPQLWENAIRLSYSITPSLVSSNAVNGNFAYSPYILSSGVDVFDNSTDAAYSNPPPTADLPPPPEPPAAPVLVDASTITVSGFATPSAGQKIAAAISQVEAVLSASPGLYAYGAVDARNLVGNQTIDVPLQVGASAAAPVTLFLGRGIYLVQKTIFVGPGSSIVGLPTGNVPPGLTDYPDTVLTAAPGAGLSAVVALEDAYNASLHDLVIDGNSNGVYNTTSNNGGTVAGAWAAAPIINFSDGTSVTDVTVKNSGSHGILVSNCNKTGVALNRVYSSGNTYSGLKLQNDWYTDVTQSAFDGNQANGVEVDLSLYTTIKNSDLSGNTGAVDDGSGSLGNGVYAYLGSPGPCPKCGGLTVVGTQSAANCNENINIAGTINNLIAGNSFFPSFPTCPSGGKVDQGIIQVAGSSGNTVVANVIDAANLYTPGGWGVQYTYLTGIVFTGNTGSNTIAGNIAPLALPV